MTAPKSPEEKKKPGPKPAPKAVGPLEFTFDGMFFRDTPELIFLKLYDEQGEPLYIGAYKLTNGVMLPDNGVAYRTVEEVDAYQRMYAKKKRQLASKLILPQHPGLLFPDHRGIIVESDNE